MGSMVLSSVKAIAQTHWIFLGLSVVAFALETCVKATPNVSERIELLEEIVLLAKDLNEFKRAMPEETEKLLKAIHVIFEGAVMCCDYIEKGQLSSPHEVKKGWYGMLKVFKCLHVVSMATFYFGWKLCVVNNLLTVIFTTQKTVGIERQVAEVKKLLDMEGSEAVIAVVLCGFGGVGKSTSAAFVIQKLNWNSASFEFCRVMIDEKTPISFLILEEAK
ncbi:hypothetical protein KI387_038862 [Taxus chinensis]|uniref:NB-ARC domain-containing protein n=1 Tax=Taxus chinensis TaxID=29808 RepID=A0AA38CEB3_TAXCH|nr:hypothetical protein KI387_038862 [Taxus chinensis]